MTFLQRGVSWRYIQNEDYFATAVRGVYEEPQNGVIAAKELLIRDDILEEAELKIPGELGIGCIPEMYPDEETGVAGGSVYDLGEEF